MQFEPAELRDRGKAFDPVDLQIGLAVTGNLDQLQELRSPGHAVALEKLLALDAVGRAHDRAWPALDVTDHPVSDGFEIAREIKFGDAFAIAAVGP